MPSDCLSPEQSLPTLHSHPSLHEPDIQEIHDQYSSFEHSANLLDCFDNRLQPLHDPAPLPEDPNESLLRRREERKLKNETKNIPKNFGKGIISFISKNERKVKALLVAERIPFGDFMARMREEKRIINTIADLRRLWTDPVLGKCMRTISNLFFRKHAMHYIFNSRISNYSSHIKYRQSLWQALKNPTAFNHIKEF
jgi:hypothetical protein